MISVNTHQHFHDTLANTYIVVTKRCQYKVEVTPEEVIIRCPGLDHPLTRNESQLLSDPDLSDEGAATIAVVYFEESNQ